MVRDLILLIILLGFSGYGTATKSEGLIVTDGSLGERVTLDGPNFIIHEHLGKQMGGNLFHSFAKFSLGEKELAAFKADVSNPTNIIARITGKEVSTIQGHLYSEAPNLYFINPNGIILGENARVNVNSFNISTADFIALGEQGIFSASNPENSLLVAAPPSAFGFLTKIPNSIEIKNSKIMPVSLKNNSISLVGGNIHIEDSILFSPNGRINLLSLGANGKVHITASGELKLQNNQKLGRIYLKQSSFEKREQSFLEIFKQLGLPEEISKDYTIANIDVSDWLLGGHNISQGVVYIRGEEFISQMGSIFADSYGQSPGVLSEIDIKVNDITLKGGTKITATNFGSGGGNIQIEASTLSIQGIDDKNPSWLAANNKSVIDESYGGNIIINAHNIGLSKGLIQTSTVGGHGGNIQIEAEDMSLFSSKINAETQGGGNAGNINVRAERINILENSIVSNPTIKGKEAGNINLVACTELFMRNSQIHSVNQLGKKSGNIKIKALNSAFIDNSLIATLGVTNDGGVISIGSQNHWFVVDKSVITSRAGDVSFSSMGSDNIKIQGGDLRGGNISLQGNPFVSSANSIIDAHGSGIDGKITINSPELNAEELLQLPNTYSTYEKMSLNLCEEQSLSRFIIIGRDKPPISPY